MPFKQYASIDALNSGLIRASMKSLRYMRRKELETKADFVYAFETGKAFALLCESKSEYYKTVELGPCKTVTAQKWQTKALENPDKIYLTEADYETLPRMYNACLENSEAKQFFADEVERELTFVWQCERTGEWLKGRADFLAKDWLVDVKTISSIYKAKYHIWDYRYDVQLVMYQDGLRHNGRDVSRVSNLFVEKVQTLPEVVMRDFTREETSAAWDEYIEAIQQIQYARKTGEYPGYQFPVETPDTISFE